MDAGRGIHSSVLLTLTAPSLLQFILQNVSHNLLGRYQRTNVYWKKVSHIPQKSDFKGSCFAECLLPYGDLFFFTAISVQPTKLKENEVVWYGIQEGHIPPPLMISILLSEGCSASYNVKSFPAGVSQFDFLYLFDFFI